MADVTDATFQTQVIERSATVPVVVDLWAEWCGPCKTLGPILESVIASTNGQVELAKVDIEANPAVARAFQAQSIPAVHALVGGKVVDSFLGAQPESVVREFVSRLTMSPEEQQVAALVAAGDEQSLRAAVQLVPTNAEARVALATLLVERGAGGDDVASGGEGGGEGDLAEALTLLEGLPETTEVRHLLALARAGGRPEGGDSAVETELRSLLGSVKDDDAARARFVDLLEVLSEADSRAAWRRKLSAQLF
ncbi:MAG: thioredoxin domain-containing protein [Microthrixaceae bacterium]